MVETEAVGQLKKIIFEDTDKRHADLKIRLHYDGIGQGAFFRMLISGYIEQDERIVDFIQEYKEKARLLGKHKLIKSKNMHEKSQEMKSVFGLDDQEIETIFDIIAKENNKI